MVTEHDIENNFIEILQDLKYTYRPDIRDRESLELNFREHFNRLNYVTLTDSEFARLKEHIITQDVYAAARTLREINSFEREDGTPLNYTLVNIKDWCKNTFEVVNQLRINTDNSHHRYDVLLLINGVPVVQIELKNHQIAPRKAMQQIIKYKNDVGNGYTRTLLCFLQLFIVSNGNDTWYFANNNNRHFSFDADERFLPLYQFADPKNKKITHLPKFAEAFLAKCTLAEMISRYMVLVASEQKLMMMRPYQIYAVQAITDCIDQDCGNGYIWHTTGSGKTLTSFKASTLLKENPYIEKCLFVVDRKDLDRQTRREFNYFQENCVEENTNTASLVERLLSKDYADKIIVTTIQKLSIALSEKNAKSLKSHYRKKLERLSSKRMVFIFDECHRSQFGENHKAIKNFFPKAQLFGFTGTPIFKENASARQIEGEQASYITTEDIFQKCLHTYTITHAIEDRNVLRFHVDYYGAESVQKAHCAPFEKRAIAKAILQKHHKLTAGRKFNAFLATSSINDAIEYYGIFKELQEEKTSINLAHIPLHIACVFSPPAEGNKDLQQLQEDLEQERKDLQVEPDKKKAALKRIIEDYNVRYKTNHSIAEFDTYYKDVQERIKNQEFHVDAYVHERVDLTIVVDMLLTGFDAKYLNTLYVDKNLKYHGLIQAFSRTNRVLNDSKPYGNVIDFRKQVAEVNEAIALFSGEQGERAKEIWLVDSAPKVIEKLQTAMEKLTDFMHSQHLEAIPSDVPNLKGDGARAQFVQLFKEVQRLSTQLDQYTNLNEENVAAIEATIPKTELQGFKGVYLDVAKRLRKEQESEDTTPEVAQLEFEFVLFASAIIDYDYIMNLIANYTSEPTEKQSMSRSELLGLIGADAKFMDEKESIEAYIKTLPAGKGLSEKEIREGYADFKATKNTQAVHKIAQKHGLQKEDVQALVDTTLRLLRFDNDALTELLEPLDLDWEELDVKETDIMKDLTPLLRNLAQGQTISGLEAYE